MKVQSFKPARSTDVKDTPGWADKYMKSRDEQIRALTQMAQGQVGGENRNEEIRSVKVQHNASATGTPYTDITLTRLRGKPVGVTVIASDAEAYPTWRYQLLDLTKLRLWVKFDPDPGVEVSVTVKVEGP